MSVKADATPWLLVLGQAGGALLGRALRRGNLKGRVAGHGLGLGARAQADNAGMRQNLRPERVARLAVQPAILQGAVDLPRLEGRGVGRQMLQDGGGVARLNRLAQGVKVFAACALLPVRLLPIQRPFLRCGLVVIDPKRLAGFGINPAGDNVHMRVVVVVVSHEYRARLSQAR